MKKFIAILLLSSVFSAAFAGPKLVFDKTSHDFGIITKGEKVSVEFKFKNEGDSDLTIGKVKTSCGCTSAALEKLVYKPGEEGTIPVSFDSTRFQRKITKTITVPSDDTDSPQTRLTITGVIQSEVDMTPTSLAIFDAKRDEVMTREIKVTTELMDKLEITDISSDLEFIKVTSEKIDPKTVLLKVSVDGKGLDKTKTNYRGSITFKTNSKSQAEMRNSVTLKVVDPIQVAPGSVYFFASKKGAERHTMVKLKSTQDKAFKILDVKSDLAFINPEVQADGSLKVSLAANAEQDGKFQGQIVVKTDLAEMPSLTIPVRGSFL